MNPADACSTICGPLIDPPQPAESVPVNLGVWVDSSAGGATALAFETDDQPVLFATLSEQRLGNDSVYTVVLDDELLPNTDYVVTPLSRRWEQPEQGPFVAMGPSTRLATWDDALRTPPPAVSINTLERSRGSGGATCSAWTQLDVVFSDSAQSGGYLELQASEDLSFGLVHAFAIGGDDIIFGNCGHRLDANTQYWWRVRSVDMAGNTSDWSEPERYRTAAQCGCTSVPTPMSWLVLAPLALLAHRRRRTG